MSMRCEVNGCASEAGPPTIVRQEDDWTRVAVSMCVEHKKGVESGALRVNRRTAQGRFELIPGPGVSPPAAAAGTPQRR
jgi:hypothetical protein